jgi:tRNA threonylcarbamoyladenosine biosynthesis protein TsaB
MNILAIDTSATACSLALSFNDQVKTLHIHAPMQQAQRVLSLLDDLLKSENFPLNQLNAIAFGCGPGSFTGLRIATSIAQGLGYALNIPLIPISSLAALAQTAYNTLGWKKLIVAIDARMQEIYWAKYQINQKGLAELIENERVSHPTQLQADQHDWYGAGNAWEIYANQLAYRPLETDFGLLPTASAILQLALPRYQNQDWVTPTQALPVYLRDEVAAKTNKR